MPLSSPQVPSLPLIFFSKDGILRAGAEGKAWAYPLSAIYMLHLMQYASGCLRDCHDPIREVMIGVKEREFL